MSRVLPRPETVLSTAVAPDARMAGRAVHPWAWWLWAISAAVAVSLARNPLLLIMLIAAVVFVVVQRRSSASWARSLGLYFLLAAIIITVRVVFQIVLGGLREGTVLFTLPEIGLPDWAAGIRLGGPVTVEGLVYTVFDAGRLAGLLICIGAANTLANPKRTLRNVPAAFHQVATALVIAISVAPQLVESVQRVRRARRLRGGVRKGISGLVSIVIPTLEDAIDRSLALAAGMESRGFGRTRSNAKVTPAEVVALIGSMLAIIFGTFGLLGLADAQGWAIMLLVTGFVAGGWALQQAGRRLGVTHYRPDPWAGPEFLVTGCGLLGCAVVVWLANFEPAMFFASYPLVWPELTWPMVVAAALIALPGVATAPTPRLG